MRNKRLWIALMAIPICLISVFLVGTQRSRQADAGGVIDPTCTSSSPCIEYDNNGTGPGIRGISVSGNGLAGLTKNHSTSAATGRAGLAGSDTGTGTFNSGVHGLSVSGFGVSGQSTSGDAIFGTSTNLAGVHGFSTNNNGVFGDSQSAFASGVYGQNDGKGYGVAGRVTQPFGLAAVLADAGSTGSDALDATSLNGTGINAQSGSGSTYPIPFEAAVIAINKSTLLGSVGVSAVSQNGPAIVGDSAGSSPTLLLETTGTGNLMDARNGGGLVMYLDNAGNMHAHSFTADLAATTGQKIVAYAPQASEPTIEDFGEATLINGSAFVRLESRFASAMAPGANYLVFITPEGDNRGLYVTQKSALGFAVHESQGGHSTLAFSYRIVAKPFGNKSPRLPSYVAPKESVPVRTKR